MTEFNFIFFLTICDAIFFFFSNGKCFLENDSFSGKTFSQKLLVVTLKMSWKSFLAGSLFMVVS